MATDDTDRWMTVAQAAKFFGRSERTIRRWIARKEIEARQDKGRTYVRINVTGAGMTGESGSGQDIDRQAVIAELEARLEEVSRQRDYLEQALAAALSKIPPQIAGPDPESKPARPWWAFWKK